MTLKPIRGQVAILPDKAPEKIGLIFTPETVVSDNPNFFTETGTVYALAPHSLSDDGEDRVPFDVKVGERVHFSRYAGKEVFWEGQRLLFMHEKDIRAIVDGDHQILHGYEGAADEGVRSYDTDPFAGL